MSNTNEFDAIFQREADRLGLDWRLLRAVATVESSLNPRAVNSADPSYGLMQILCTHHADGVCTNQFPAVRQWSGATTEKLLDPSYNVTIGAEILAWNLRAYGTIEKAIAVYNAWDQRNAPPRGPFKNQRYVDKVLAEYRRLGGA